MQQYFVTGEPHSPFVVTDKATAKHMFQVMRLKGGDELILVFEDGIKRLAKVLNSQEQSFEILEPLEDNKELPVHVSIAMGFPKGDKLEFVAQKATELGMAELWAYPADWSVVKWDHKKLAKKADKLAKIVLGAAEQSKRNRLPKVQLFGQKERFFEAVKQADVLLVAYEESAKEGERHQLKETLAHLKKGSRVVIVFGPEGGLSEQEIDQLANLGGKMVGLGPRILRTETAPLYALSAFSYALELED
ncbi:16S rRNA (uracil(1498)-N(3))-methyltransferase [Streptococcus sp. zg-JUN1979]|uniref:16S rRNA (uracil(1498)-N(3))-methyltransferase n=1 Tax=Streptococcus sp. zg-JUN1979 TaxID=3391450 RepID=UPI0039A4D6BF